MNKKNFDVVVDIGIEQITSCSFFKDSDTINYSNKFSFNKKDNLNFELKNDIVENLIFDIEKNNKEHLNEILLMTDLSKMTPVSFNVFKKSNHLVIDKKLINHLILEAKQEISHNYKDYEILHIVIVSYKIDDGVYRELPENIKCEKISIELIFINFSKEYLNLIKKPFNESNISIRKVICSSFAKSNFYSKKLDYDGQVGFIDIGYDKTSLFYFDKKKFNNYQIIPIGSKHITSDISKIFKIDLITAEEIKANFDNASFINKNKNYNFELIKEVIFSRIEEILELSTKIFKDQNNLDKIKLIFFGSGSKILDNKFKRNISFDQNIDLLDEEDLDVCKAGLNLFKDESSQEVEIISKNHDPKGIFEKFFNLFR